MQVNIVVSVVIQNAKQVLLLQTQKSSFKLPSADMKVHESPIDTVRQLIKELGITEEWEIKHLIGIYSLQDMEKDVNTLVFAFVANVNEEFPLHAKGSPSSGGEADQPTMPVGRQVAEKMKKERFKIVAKEKLEKLVEEEKQLEDASINCAILRDYLQGDMYSLDLLKRVEDVKL